MPTVFDNYTKQMPVRGADRTLVIFDTGGEVNNMNFRKASFAGTDCFVICFALDNEQSFTSTHMDWMNEL